MKHSAHAMPSMPEKPKATVRLHVPKELVKTHPPNASHRVGKTTTLEVRGTVTSLSQDQYGHSVELELSEPNKERDGMKADMKAMKKRHTLGYGGMD